MYYDKIYFQSLALKADMVKVEGKMSSAQKRRMRRLGKSEEDGNNNKSGASTDVVEEEDTQKECGTVANDGGNISANVKGASSSKPPVRKKSRRQSGEIIWEDDHFPPCQKFQPPTKLPTIKSVVGRVRYLTKGGKHQEKKDMALK